MTIMYHIIVIVILVIVTQATFCVFGWATTLPGGGPERPLPGRRPAAEEVIALYIVMIILMTIMIMITMMIMIIEII